MSAEPSLAIGWAQGSITPEQPVNLFGMFNERISTHVEDACLATALALEGPDGEQAIWISCDLVGIQRDVVREVRTRVATRIPGFNGDKLLISCTHTHNAPNFKTDLFPPPPSGAMAPAEYRMFFIDQTVETAVRAWEARSPGQVTPALGHAVVGWCRRLVLDDGTGLMYGDTHRDDFIAIEGPMDPGVELLFTHAQDGKLTGAVVSIAATPQTCMSQNFLSADFWGPARQTLRDHFGSDFTVLAVTGAAGDQCPDDLIRRNRSEPQMRGLEACARLARRLTRGVVEGYEEGRRETTASPVFRHVHAVLELPPFVMSDEQVAHYEQEITRLTANGEPDPTSWDGGTLLRARRCLKQHTEMSAGEMLEVDCNFLRIGDLAVATNPFELFLEYGQRIKACSPAVQTISAQLTNDSLQYLPTYAALTHGHYSAMPSNIKAGPEGGDRLVALSLEYLNGLFVR